MQRAALLIGRPARNWLISALLGWNVPANFTVTTGTVDAGRGAW